MTTRQWLLNVLDNMDIQVDRDIPPRERTSKWSAIYSNRKRDIEKARRLVEQGPDEP